MNTASPLVIIITPAYNRASFLGETIESVLNQDYPNIEYIVLDDGSTDHTRQILEGYNGRITWETHTNMGETRTVNKGFSMAQGEIVCVVNSDDPLLPGAVDAAVKTLRENPNALAAYPDWLEIGPDSSPIREYKLPQYTLFNMLTDFNVAMGPGTFFRRKVLDDYGMRDPSVKYTGDLEFWFRLALHGDLVHIPETLATHRTHPTSASVSDRGPIMAGELIRLVEKVFSHPGLPPEILTQKSRVFCRAHHDAASYCGNHHLAAFRHHLLGVAHHPLWSARIAARILFFKTAPWCDKIYYGFRARLYHFSASIYRRVRYFIRIKMLTGLVDYISEKGYQSLFLMWSFFCNAGRMWNRSGSGKSRPAKFSFLSHVLPPSWSGQAVVIQRLLEGVETRSYCLISSQDYSAKQDFIGRLPASYHVLPPELQFKRGMTLPGIFKLNTMLGVIGRGRNIAKVLRAEKCGALVAGTGDLIDLPAACLAAVLSGIPFYPYLFDDFAYQWADPVYREMARRFETVLFKNAAGVIVPNEFLQIEIQKRHEVDAGIVRNCCDRAALEAKSTRADKKQGEPFHIVYTGAIYHVNFGAFRNLIKTLESTLLAQVYLHLYTAQPEDFLHREGICGERVIQHQHVSPAEVVRAQQAADILFIPFSFDCPVTEIVKTSAPGKFGDYLASGTPILAHLPADSFVSWYLQKFGCGIVVEKEDPALLREAILTLIKDASLRMTLSENARRCAQLDFSPELACQRFLSAVGVR